jgi:Protein of unknown function (DUF3562)
MDIPGAIMPSDHSKEDQLARVRGQLEAEYGETLPRERIDRAAEEAVAALSDARIRDFIPLLAWRQARARLRSGAA